MIRYKGRLDWGPRVQEIKEITIPVLSFELNVYLKHIETLYRTTYQVCNTYKPTTYNLGEHTWPSRRARERKHRSPFAS